MNETNIEFDYSKLKGRIVEKYDMGGTSKLANEVGMSYRLLLAKLSNARHFTQHDIYSICKALDITDVNEYFFKVK